ncbi:MAG: hypothetical protein PHU75_06670 [Candidatus Nanopelagicales bacterium]|nr:hypothetical protein [Candidatus Nanopelagicales bacterium]
MRTTTLACAIAALIALGASPAYAAGDPAPPVHGQSTAPAAAAPAPVAPSVAPAPVVTATPTPAPAASSAAPEPVAVIDEATQRALEVTYAKGESKAADLHGVMESLYRGKWFNAKDEDTRRCIARKETGGNYESVSAGGLYRGAYQMSKALAVGAAWMMLDEVRKELGAEAAATVADLRSTPVQRWNRYWQDRAFWTIWRNGAGSSHWRVGGC